MAASAAKEHYIPLRKADVVDWLAAEPTLTQQERESFRSLCQIVTATFHLHFHELLEQLKETYGFFDPDRVTQRMTEVSESEEDEQADRLFDHLCKLLEHGNFRSLSRTAIEEAARVTSAWAVRLRVDFDVFDRWCLYVRGERKETRYHRSYKRLFRKEAFEVPTYDRIVLLFRFKRSPQMAPTGLRPVYLKLFGKIPKMDLEMLMPGSKICMTLFDRGKIVLPTITGLGMVGWKVIKGGLILASTGLYGTLAFLGLIGGTIGYGIKSYHGYVHTRQRYQLALTESLYYQNLDNNAGVLFRLLDEAEEQECREAILAYFVLWRQAGPEGWTIAELDRKIEEMLRAKLGRAIDFEIHDALDKLRRLKVVRETSAGRVAAVPVAEALRVIDHAWDHFFLFNDCT